MSLGRVQFVPRPQENGVAERLTGLLTGWPRMLRRRTERAMLGSNPRRIRLVQLLGLHREAAVGV